jgi:aminodeoxyfutalosine synthase
MSGEVRESLTMVIVAGRVPFERDTMYRPVTRSEDTFTVGV